jgi:hypothetical protein
MQRCPLVTAATAATATTTVSDDVCHFADALPSKASTTIRFFKRGDTSNDSDFYCVYKEDATFVAREFYKTMGVIKTIGACCQLERSKCNSHPSCTLLDTLPDIARSLRSGVTANARVIAPPFCAPSFLFCALLTEKFFCHSPTRVVRRTQGQRGAVGVVLSIHVRDDGARTAAGATVSR